MTDHDLLAGPGARTLLDAINEAVYVVDRNRTITYWNPAAERLTGFSAEAVVGRRCRDAILNHVDENGRLLCRSRCPLAMSMLDGQPREAVLFLHHHDGHRVPVAVRTGAVRGTDGTVIGGIETFYDDSGRRELADSLGDVEHQALTDELTGVPNRRMLERTLRQHHDDHRRHGQGFAVLFADVDHFKAVNDTYGHDTGDEVLRVVATTLRNCVRRGDTVGRWGGEEFLILVTSADHQSAARLANRARRLVAGTWTVRGGRRVRVTLTIGIAFARPGEPPRDVVRRADAAMLAAKKRGGDRSEVA